MFKAGEKIVDHDGKVHKVRKNGIPKSLGHPGEMPRIRGFVRGALVDCLTGEERMGDWHENTITTAGHMAIVRNFAGLASSASSVAATVTSDLQLARFWGIGYHTGALTAGSDLSSLSTINSSEWPLASTGGVSRATVSVGSQLLSGTWTLSQSFQYASSHISHAQTVNMLCQYAHSSVGVAGHPALSMAAFASSTKGTTQALNITYNWVFST
jgi:hypothetical protein